MFNVHVSRRMDPRVSEENVAQTTGCARMAGRDDAGIGNSGARERHSNAGYTTLLFTLEPEEILHFQTTLFLHPAFLSFLPRHTRSSHSLFLSRLVTQPDLLFSTLVYSPSFRFLGARKEGRAEVCAPLFITIYSDS